MRTGKENKEKFTNSPSEGDIWMEEIEMTKRRRAKKVGRPAILGVRKSVPPKGGPMRDKKAYKRKDKRNDRLMDREY